jgi:multiple sugar transport system ATP-binding protein
MVEPLSNLDAKMRVKARAEIADLHHRLGATFIYVTHDQTEAMTMSDRVAVMLDGRLLQVDTPQQLYAEPQHLSVARFIGTPEINVLDAKTAPGRVEVAGRTWPLAIDPAGGDAVHLAVRPEALSPAVASDPCQLDGTVAHIEHLGADDYIHVSVPGVAERIVVRVDPTRGARFAIGAQTAFAVAPDRVLAFAGDGRRLSIAVVDGQASGAARLREVAHG